MAEEARKHHMQMKYLLAQMAIQNPERFFSTFGPGGNTAYLTDLWTAVGQQMPADQRVAAGTIVRLAPSSRGIARIVSPDAPIAKGPQ